MNFIKNRAFQFFLTLFTLAFLGARINRNIIRVINIIDITFVLCLATYILINTAVKTSWTNKNKNLGISLISIWLIIWLVSALSLYVYFYGGHDYATLRTLIMNLGFTGLAVYIINLGR